MKLIDIQHSIIDESLEKLKKLIIQRERCDVKLKEILEDLVIFYDSHFYTEQLYLNRNKLKGSINEERLNDHIKDHENFLEFIHEALNDKALPIEVYLKLEKWSKEHVKDYDVQDLGIETEE